MHQTRQHAIWAAESKPQRRSRGKAFVFEDEAWQPRKKFSPGPATVPTNVEAPKRLLPRRRRRRQESSEPLDLVDKFGTFEDDGVKYQVQISEDRGETVVITYLCDGGIEYDIPRTSITNITSTRPQNV